MGVNILLITHNKVGDTLLDTASMLMGDCPIQIETIAVPDKCNPENILNSAKHKLSSLDSGNGVLVLTDIYGSTPSNIACKLGTQENVIVITGVSLPMLMRIMNYPGLSLEELSRKAIEAGKDGVMYCKEGNK
jgi:PTS system mannose-specific IIA component